MRKPARVCLAIVLLAITPASCQNLQDITSKDSRGDTGYRAGWDSDQEAAFIFRDVNSADQPAARIVSRDGRSVTAIYPLKDFPDAQHWVTWAASSNRDGGLTIAATVLYAANRTARQPVKSVIVGYDNNGNTKRIWEVHPYHFHHLAVDEEGSVFALGDRTDTRADADYPLLIKYSQTGTVEKELLWSKQFGGDKVVASGSSNGESQLFISHGEVYVWLAPALKLIRISEAGEVKGTVSLEPALQKLIQSKRADNIRVLKIAGGPDGPLAQVKLSFNSERPALVGMIKFSQDGQQSFTVSPMASTVTPGLLIGTDQSGKPVFVDGDSIVRQ